MEVDVFFGLEARPFIALVVLLEDALDEEGAALPLEEAIDACHDISSAEEGE